MKPMKPYVLLLLLLTGCINVTTTLTPADMAVARQIEGADCTINILGISIGTNRYETAKAHGVIGIDYRNQKVYTPIRRVHVVQFTDYVFFSLVGWRCLEILGEP